MFKHIWKEEQFQTNNLTFYLKKLKKKKKKSETKKKAMCKKEKTFKLG